MSELIVGDLSRWVEDLIDTLGFLGVAVLIALENVFPPIPSEVVLPAAGLYAERNGGVPTLIGMIVAATVGSVVGAYILYGIGAWIGPERLREFVIRRGRWIFLTTKDLDRGERWFDRHQQLAVLVGRCVPLVRSVVSLPAGFRRMPLPRFTLYTATGSAIWNSALILVGYAASSRQDTLESVIGYAQYVIVATIVGVIAVFVWRRAAARKGSRAGRT